MMISKEEGSIWWLAAILDSQPNRESTPRRLIATVRLMQWCGVPVDYAFRSDAFGIFSEDVQADIRLLEAARRLEIVQQEGTTIRYRLVAEIEDVSAFSYFRTCTWIMNRVEEEGLQLVAAHASYQSEGHSDDEAKVRIRSKNDWNFNREVKALTAVCLLNLFRLRESHGEVRSRAPKNRTIAL